MQTSFSQAINQALRFHFSSNPRSVFIGLGANDPKRIFGTTNDLVELFGSSRVIEPPTSENALTGIALGLCLNSYSVCLTHQRADFALLSFDQIINSVAKWNFMFDRADSSIPLLVRMIVGRGWGQGPTHSQSFHSLLASIPGLNVYYPFSPETAYSDILYGLSSGTPTIVFEHRWLYGGSSSSFSTSPPCTKPPAICHLRSGTSFTIATYGYLVPLALKLHTYLSDFNISFDLFAFNSVAFQYPRNLFDELASNNSLLLLDSYYCEGSFLSFLLVQILSDSSCHLSTYKHIGLPFEPESTSYFKTKQRYFDFTSLVQSVSLFLGNSDILIPVSESSIHHDIPGSWFEGPF